MIQNTTKLDFKIKAGDTVETYHITANLNSPKELIDTPEMEERFAAIDEEFAPIIDAAKEKEAVSKRLNRVTEDISGLLQIIPLEEDASIKKTMLQEVQAMRTDKRKLEDQFEEINARHSRAKEIEATNRRDNAIAKEMFLIGIQDGPEKEKLVNRLEELNFAFTVAYQELASLAAEARKKK